MTDLQGPASFGHWGTAPQPLPEEPRRSSLHGALIVLVVMFGWLLTVFGLSSVVARNDPNVEVPVTMDLGVVVTPADGWYRSQDSTDDGKSRLVVQKSGSYVVFEVEQYSGTNEQLVDVMVEGLRTAFDSFRSLPARSVQVAGDLDGLAVNFSGFRDGGQEEDELVALSYKGIGIVVLAEASPGQFRWIQDDVDTMLETLEVPR